MSFKEKRGEKMISISKRYIPGRPSEGQHHLPTSLQVHLSKSNPSSFCGMKAVFQQADHGKEMSTRRVRKKESTRTQSKKEMKQKEKRKIRQEREIDQNRWGNFWCQDYLPFHFLKSIPMYVRIQFLKCENNWVAKMRNNRKGQRERTNLSSIKTLSLYFAE
jgi:hypothetical protein